ncbi:MAG TPA: hypothetical protein VHU17_01250 [Acidimicrobiales bacterium]|jgi:hypothetical protein|nr:hypothetical protein [Acidimicrobiales bacterium]
MSKDQESDDEAYEEDGYEEGEFEDDASDEYDDEDASDDYDDDAYEDFEDDEFDEEPAAPARSSGAMEWVRSSTQRLTGTPRSTNGAPVSERDAKRAIYMLNDRERLFSFASAVVAAGFGVAIYVSETSNKHFRLTKSQLTPQTMLLVGLVAAALLVVATLVGRRALVGFMVFFAGAGFSTNSFVLALPFWALAFWLLYRSSRIQRQRTQELRAERAARPRSTNTSGRASGSGSRSSSRKAKSGSATGPKRPEANKRYTPPKPPPKPKPAPPARRPKKTTAKKSTTKND